MRRLVFGLCALALGAGCGGTAGEDAGATPDAAADGGLAPDTGARAPDGGAPLDAGPADAGAEDGGAPDAGIPPLGPVTVDLSSTRPPERLSGYGFFRWVGGEIEYNERVVAYDLNVPLFSDYAIKRRALYIPEGTTIRYTETGILDFPVGSAIVKSFLMAPDLRSPQDGLQMIETRVLVKYEDEWRAFPYRWLEDQSDAEYFVRGEVRAIDFIDPYGQPRTTQYLIPQKNQCLECHEVKDEQDERVTTLVGPRARYLNRDHAYAGETENQLARLARLGMLEGLPASPPAAFDWSALTSGATSSTALDAAGIERAARDYLDINCAHCHRPNATQGMTSRLWLNWDNEDEFHLGFCKEPGSAGSAADGRQYDIVPGDAEASILVYRTETEEVGEMMPLIGRSVADDLAVDILRAWVDGLPADDCSD